MPIPHLPTSADARGVPKAGPLVDRFGRSKHKLRLSLTDRCNFRCGYCMPDDPVWTPRDQLLSLEELHTLAALFVRRLGITHLRLTGGEPLLRRGVLGLLERLNELRPHGLARIALTTNGSLLARYATRLRDLGIDNLNVSLDSLDPRRFKAMTAAELGPVLQGIEAARDAGLDVKLNTVVIRGENEDDIVPLARWALQEGLKLRFIEFMPLDGRGTWNPSRVVPEREIVARLRQEFAVEALPRSREPATYYLLEERQPLGVISTVSNPFCASCDRVRVTATGALYACLFSPVCSDLRALLRAGDLDTLEQRIRAGVWDKGKGFIESSGYVQRQISMNGLGG